MIGSILIQSIGSGLFYLINFPGFAAGENNMSTNYQRFSGVCAVLSGLLGLTYLGLFVALRDPAALAPALCLLAVGVLSSAVIVAVYRLVQDVDGGFALWGLALGIVGALGAAIHAAFDVSNNLNPPGAAITTANAVDPRGFLTFAIAGLATVILAWLILRGNVFPRAVGMLGMAAGLLLILLYAAYLVILDATNPLVLALVLLSGVLQPVWYLGIGWQLLQRKKSSRSGSGTSEKKKGSRGGRRS